MIYVCPRNGEHRRCDECGQVVMHNRVELVVLGSREAWCDLHSTRLVLRDRPNS